jgi:hypothetical protein
MIEPWFDPNAYAWIPGTALGVLLGLWGSVAGVLASRGKARGLVLGSAFVLMLASLACLALSIWAFIVGQPYGVGYGLGLPGVLGTLLLPCLAPVMRSRYRQAETQRLQAKDL